MRESALSRVRKLPDIFTLATLMSMMEWDAKEAAVYLLRWKKAGLVESAGDRLPIYFNKLKIDQVDSSHRIRVLQHVYPTATLMGASVLHANLWTTQIPYSLHVAILRRDSYVAVDGFTLHPRTKAWFKKVHDNLVSPETAEFSTYGLRALPPALALADLFGDPNAWHPDPDDLDLDDHEEEIKNAFAKLEIGIPDSLSFLLEERSVPRRMSFR